MNMFPTMHTFQVKLKSLVDLLKFFLCTLLLIFSVDFCYGIYPYMVVLAGMFKGTVAIHGTSEVELESLSFENRDFLRYLRTVLY